LLVAALVAPSVSLGAPPRTIATTGEGAGAVSNPQGMAVDRTSGDLYVADYNNFRIDKFGPEGEFLLAWGFGVADGTSSELQSCGPDAVPPTASCFPSSTSTSTAPGAMRPIYVAVDQSNGDVYVSDENYARVQKFSPSGEFLLMFGREVDKTSGADVCTKADVAGGDECGAGVQGGGPGQFESNFLPVAVDSAGRVWVADNERIEEFSSSGAFLSEVAVAGANLSFERAGLAVNAAGDFYLVSQGSEGVQKLDSTGAEIETLDVTGGLYRVIALDAAGNLFVGDRQSEGSPATFREFNAAGEQVSEFGTGQVFGSFGPQGIAIGDTAKALYSDSFTFEEGARYAVQKFSIPAPGPLPEEPRATNVLPTTATLQSSLNPENRETTYHFEYGTTTGYGESTPAGTLAPSFEASVVEAGLEHLLPETTYHFRLVASNHCNPAEPAEICTVAGEDATFTTPPPVAIDSQSVTDVAATSATFAGELNPFGAGAEWWVEYGTGAGYGLSTPVGSLPAQVGDVSVSAHVQGLEPATTYHYRFAARDMRDGVTYTVHGADRTFTTQLTALGFQLPDGRGWELVTPVDKGAAIVKSAVLVEGLGLTQASSSGDALTFITQAPIDSTPEGNRATEFAQAMARHGAGGWNAEDITTPYTSATGLHPGRGNEYRFFSSDLAQSVVEPRDTNLLSPEASERTPYLRSDFAEPPSYRPLVTGKEGFANVPPGTEFGGDPSNPLGGLVELRGASPDLAHSVLRSAVPLVTGAPAGALYEWGGGQLRTVSVLPANEGGETVGGATELGGGAQGVRGAVSADGSRVFWRNGASGSPLYLRDTSRGESVRLDAVQPGGSGGGAAEPIFQGASADGSRAFFTDTQRLTADASNTGADLYECRVRTSGGELGCDITDLTPGGAAGASVQGLLPGLSEDGKQLYLVANGALASGATPGNCTTAAQPAATCNLYSLRFDEASGKWGTRFLATLSNEDANDWGVGVAAPSNRSTLASLLSAASSPNGRYLAFMSQRSLTGYDNRDAASGQRDEEVFVYDAAGDRLTCASCDPSGARPAGELDEDPSEPEAPKLRVVDPAGLWSGHWLAASLTLPHSMELGYAISQPRFVLDNGRVFFNAIAPAVPADSNGAWDVYEYEPLGIGGCAPGTSGSSSVATASGCVGLLSAGTSSEESAFLEASADGDDAFLLTSAPLSGEDVDARYDVYDAHVCGAGWQCPPPRPPAPAPCGSVGSCRPTGGAEEPAAPASATFSGGGNVKPKHHRKHHKKRHTHHKKRHHKHAAHRRGGSR
jgi:DNA-binding beta-propeller fold protein YncE